MEEQNFKVDYNYNYWLLIILIVFLSGFFLFLSVSIIDNVIEKLLLLFSSIYSFGFAIYLLISRISKVVFKDAITMKRLILKDIIIKKDSIILVSNDYIKTDKKSFFIKHIRNKDKIIQYIIEFLEIKNVHDAVQGTKQGAIIYTSEEKMDKSLAKRNKNILIYSLSLTAVGIVLFLSSMFINHWSLSQAIIVIIIVALMIVLAIISDSAVHKIKSRIIRFLLKSFIIVFSIALGIGVFLVVYRILQLFGIDISKIIL